MLYKAIDINGEHPDILVDEKPGEIRQSHYSQFWTAYCTELESDADALDVKQLPLETQTLIVTCDAIPQPKLDSIVRSIQSYLRTALVFDDMSDNDVRCVITVSTDVTRLYFPYCRLVAADIENMYMPAISQLVLGDGVIVQKFHARAPTSLYGSTPEKYLTCLDDVLPEEENQLDLSDFDPMDHVQIEQELIDVTYLPEGKNVTFWLPLLLSINYWRSITRRHNQIPSMVRQERYDFTYDVTKLVSKMPVEDKPHDLGFYINFIQMWKVDRIVDAAYWKIIGQALYTLERGDSRGLNGWVSILEQAYKDSTKPNFITGNDIRKMCTSIYYTFQQDEIDVRSLAECARDDSPLKYEEWHNNWILEAATGSLSGSEAVIGRVFYRIHWLDYVADATDARTIFYKFLDHRLNRTQAGIALRLMISSSFTGLYTAMKANVDKQKLALTANAASCDLAIKMIDDIIDKLGRQRYKRELLGDLAERFSIPNIRKFIDANREITLVKNGVLCVSGHNIIFRRGRLQDYLVKSFGATYNDTYTWSHPRVQEVMRWAFITFIDKDTITFFWKFLASLLRGGNTDKKFFFWSGPMGNNMKTTWQLFVSKICGDKCISMPINYFTMGKGAANNAAPAEVRREGARLTFSEEPENKTPFLVSIVKSIVGNDKQPGRGLYEETRDIEPQDKTVVVCNYPPPISKESAIEDRVIIIEFGSRVSYNAPKTEDERVKDRHFPRDPLFDRKLPGMVDAGLWIMVQMYSLYSREGITNPPESVLKATREYWKSIDKYNIFFVDNIVKEDSDSLEPFAVYNEFFRWHERTYRRIDVPTKDVVMKELVKLLGDPVNDLWQGWSLRKKNNAQEQRKRD